jgi:hypothetical protein
MIYDRTTKRYQPIERFQRIEKGLWLMTDHDDMDEKCREFLIKLLDRSQGDTQAQISMYDIGTVMNLDKNDAKRVAEALIGRGMVEIKTLSGGIGITEAGIEAARTQMGDQVSLDESIPVLSDDPVLEEKTQEVVEKIVTGLKSQVGNMGLAFDSIAELIADLKTIEIQLTSSRPKTAIIRECFLSIRAVLENTEAEESLFHIKRLLADR